MPRSGSPATRSCSPPTVMTRQPPIRNLDPQSFDRWHAVRMPAHAPQDTIWVVVRIDHYDDQLNAENVRERITLKEALPTAEEADAEADRLNELREGKSGVSYFAAPVRWFPEGRDVEVGY